MVECSGCRSAARPVGVCGVQSAKNDQKSTFSNHVQIGPKWSDFGKTECDRLILMNSEGCLAPDPLVILSNGVLKDPVMRLTSQRDPEKSNKVVAELERQHDLELGLGLP